MIVFDASAALELLLATDRGARVSAFIAATDSSLNAPHLIDVEVLQSLRRFVLRNEFSNRRVQQALTEFFDLEITRYPHAPLAERIWSLRDNMTAYDASYVALAEMLHGQLLTCDKRMARFAESHVRCVIV